MSRAPDKPNATPAEVEAQLVAIAEHGGVRPAARALKVPESTLRHVADRNGTRLAQIRADFARAREERTAATVAAIPDDIDAARKRLREIVDSPDASPGQIGSASDSLIRMAHMLDGQARLDQNRPTSIVGDNRTGRTPAEVLAEIDALKSDPRVVAFIASRRNSASGAA